MNTVSTTTEGLEAIAERFSGISKELLASYDRLAMRAARVERELARANQRLESKVRELDRISSHLEAVLEALPTGVVVQDADGRLERVNAAALALTGEPDLESLAGRQAELIPREPEEGGETVVRNSTGDLRRLMRVGRAIEDVAGQRLGAVWILEDITDRLRLEEQIRVAEKMSALGTLSAGVAHEIRNPLNAVAGFASLLAASLPAGSKQRRWADCIVQGALKTDEVVSGLVSFARPGGLELARVELSALVREVCQDEWTARQAAQRWSLDVSIEELAVHVDRVKLRQALRNLVANALDCQPNGGRVRIRALGERGCLTLSVEDAGPGVRPEHAARLFEPFFTTRPRGTGLGLALAHTVARLHGGDLKLADEPSELGGATFLLQVPMDPTNPRPQ